MMWTIRLWPRLSAGALILSLVACSAAPARPDGAADAAVASASPSAPIREIAVVGPEVSAELMQALQALVGQRWSDEVAQQAQAIVRDYYAWLEWDQLQLVQRLPGEDGVWTLTVDGLPPAEATPPPLAWATILPPDAVDREEVAAMDTALTEADDDPPDALWLASPSRVLVDATRRRLFVKRRDGSLARYDVAVGADRTPTPAGEYRVETIAREPTWFPTASIRREHAARGRRLPTSIPPGHGNPLGPYFIRLQNSIGIHGTDQPNSIGRAASHGCVRMHDRDVMELARQLRPGDGVTVVHNSDPGLPPYRVADRLPGPSGAP